MLVSFFDHFGRDLNQNEDGLSVRFHKNKIASGAYKCGVGGVNINFPGPMLGRLRFNTAPK